MAKKKPNRKPSAPPKRTRSKVKKAAKKSTVKRKKNNVLGHATRAFTYTSAAPTVQVTVVRTTVGGAQLSAKINKQYLTFAGDTAHAVVGKGQTNTLAWAVVGPPGSSYTIAVTDPKGTDCGGGTTLGKDGKDAGVCVFRT